MKNFVENYKLIRKNLYEDVFSSLKLHGWKKKYSKIKALLCIEIGAFLTFFALKFKVKPNTITLLFVLLVVIATILPPVSTFSGWALSLLGRFLDIGPHVNRFDCQMRNQFCHDCGTQIKLETNRQNNENKSAASEAKRGI